MTTDDHLMIQFQQGSQEAFTELFERYRDVVYGFFRRRLDHPARAEELTQDCFLALLKNVQRYEPRATFRSYLFGIASNMVSAERRSSAQESARSQPLNESFPRTSVRPRSGADDAALWVQTALEKLEKSEREIVMLREYEQLSYAEIAALLRLPINTVRSRLFRARMALKDQLMPAKEQLDRGIQ